MEKKFVLVILILAIVVSMLLLGCTYEASVCGDRMCNGRETASTCPNDCGSNAASPPALPANGDSGVEPTMPWQ
ncbi:MAG: hypothetical protein NTZ73_01770 [Candidatus Diapherotrites archaeon]|nr:hypothetical protein [Candidatus Diapherotrites archaeon]